MKKKILLLTGLLLVMSAVSYSAPKNSLEDNLNAIEGKFNALLEKEAQRAYCKRFPVANLMELNLWQLDVTYFKFTDNRLGFGKKLILLQD